MGCQDGFQTSVCVCVCVLASYQQEGSLHMAFSALTILMRTAFPQKRTIRKIIDCLLVSALYLCLCVYLCECVCELKQRTILLFFFSVSLSPFQMASLAFLGGGGGESFFFSLTSLFVLNFPPSTAASKIHFTLSNSPTTIFLCNSQFIRWVDEYVFFHGEPSKSHSTPLQYILNGFVKLSLDKAWMPKFEQHIPYMHMQTSSKQLM